MMVQNEQKLTLTMIQVSRHEDLKEEKKVWKLKLYICGVMVLIKVKKEENMEIKENYEMLIYSL